MLRKNATFMRLMSTPSNVTLPLNGSYKRSSIDMTVDLPQPDGPMMQVSFCAGRVRFRSLRIVWFGLEGYKKVT
jgi:hypothetical protein